jgi:hypothetical protein
MKKIVFMILLLLSLTVFATVFVNAATTTGAPDIKLVFEEVTPEPVEPGQDLTIKIRIYNAGGANADNVIITRVYDYPFKLKSANQDVSLLGAIAIGGSRDETSYITVSPRAKSGIYPLKYLIETHYNSGIVSYSEHEILINVIGNPEIILDASLPDEISPNSDFNLMLEIKNIGTGNARNIKIRSDYEGIAPKGSNMIFIEQLTAQNNTSTIVIFKVGEAITPGFYQVPFTIEITNEKGEKIISTQKIGITVIHKADISIQDLKIQPGTVAVGGKISIQARVENIGKGDADNVYVELKLDPAEGLSGFKKAYIGKLEADDDAPAIFTLTAMAENKYKTQLIIHYTDDLGEHTKIENLNLSVSNKPIDWYYWAIAIVMVLILGYYFYTKRNKTPKK